jgi:hypothetical protein
MVFGYIFQLSVKGEVTIKHMKKRMGGPWPKSRLLN